MTYWTCEQHGLTVFNEDAWNAHQLDAHTDLMDRVQVGDFVQFTLVTDTRVYEVVGKTATGLRIRGTRNGDKVKSENVDGNPWPVVYTEVLADPEAEVRLVRRRKDGTYRVANWANRLRPATMIDGKPVDYTDYRY